MSSNLKNGGYYEDRQKLDDMFTRAKLAVEVAMGECTECEKKAKLRELERMRAMIEDEQNGDCGCAPG